MQRLRKIANDSSGLPVYDKPESIKKLEEYTYDQINNGESNDRILELAKYNFYMSMTAVKIEEVVNAILKQQGR